MPGPFHLPAARSYRTADCEIRTERIDPANLAQYGVKREHPGVPPPRPGELPWIGKTKKTKKGRP